MHAKLLLHVDNASAKFYGTLLSVLEKLKANTEIVNYKKSA